MSLRDRDVTEAVYIATNADGCFPAATAQAGTITSVGVNVIGVGTSFNALQAATIGGKLYIYASGQIRLIVAIQSDTQMVLNRPFSSDLGSATAWNYVPNLQYFNISI